MEEINQNLNLTKIASLEAVLFIYGEEITKEKIAKILKTTKEEIEQLVLEYKKILEDTNRGFYLIDKNDRVVLATKPEFSSILEDFIKDDLKEDLTPATLETLSLVAYLGPISRTQIDYIRGVNSSFILRNLLIRGLVERKPGKGGSFLYEVSFDFLKHIGASSVEDLPEFEKYQKMKGSFFSESADSTDKKNIEDNEETKTEKTENNLLTVNDAEQPMVSEIKPENQDII